MDDPGDRTATAATDVVERWRNIGVVAHINAGKTTLTERILFDSGRQRFCGDVDAGTATMDWQREEQQRGISIDAAVTDVAWRGQRIQLVDTPGHVDFTAEVERSLRVLDGAIVVLDGVRGVEPQTEAVWHLLDRFEVPRLVFVNKLDRPAASFEQAVDSIAHQLACRTVPLVLPLLGSDGSLGGLLDAVGGQYLCWACDAPAAGVVEAARLAVLEACADIDERVLAAFVDRGEVSDVDLRAAVRAATLERRLLPVYAGSALHNRGVEPLLDGVCRFLPSPADRLRTLLPAASDDQAEAAVAFVFKSFDRGPREASLPLVRVFRGQLRGGQELETGDGRTVRVGALYSVRAVEQAEVDSAGPGAIVGIEVGEPLRSGETLRAPGTDVVLEPTRFSEPVLSMRVEPISADGFERLESAARFLAEDDPTLRIGRDPATGSLLVSGMGELHLDVFRERLERRLRTDVRFGVPTVLRLETVSRPGEGRAECTRLLGDLTLRAEAVVRVEPAPEQGVVFRWAVSKFPASVQREELLRELAGFAAAGLHAPLPVRDVAIEIVALDAEGPAEMCVPLVMEATELACRRAFAAGGPRVLEPRVRFVVEVPSESVSRVLAELRSRDVRIGEILPQLDFTGLWGTARLAGFVGYATRLRSLTRGRGRFELSPDGFEVAPGA